MSRDKVWVNRTLWVNVIKQLSLQVRVSVFEAVYSNSIPDSGQTKIFRKLLIAAFVIMMLDARVEWKEKSYSNLNNMKNHIPHYLGSN